MDEKVLLAFVRRYLRKASSRWKPIYETRLRRHRLYTGPRKRQKYEYQCEDCQQHFPAGKVEVHHIVPVGSLRTVADLPGFVTRLFCGDEGLKLLCKGCHRKH
jgi:5-methylcytosine-specific restriction endonuclease McrA